MDFFFFLVASCDELPNNDPNECKFLSELMEADDIDPETFAGTCPRTVYCSKKMLF